MPVWAFCGYRPYTQSQLYVGIEGQSASYRGLIWSVWAVNVL
ncbi:hypothetical protein CEV32_1869 [Brucella rhizosphaerae]|uniref:Uncharacterized protein n=1 Tax=Brucella rhizosphaerae TaxID=571254 RepID=A0A256F3K0_9HYPH|nr:hypothetical protein CEV32_1869 [Brucella rhizosphaerae]